MLVLDYEKAREIVLSALEGKVSTITATRTVLALKEATIEAAPVVHGRWIEDDARGCRCCSVCEFEVHDDASHVMFGDWEIAPNYCPNCGARMDGGGNA